MSPDQEPKEEIPKPSELEKKLSRRRFVKHLILATLPPVVIFPIEYATTGKIDPTGKEREKAFLSSVGIGDTPVAQYAKDIDTAVYRLLPANTSEILFWPAYITGTIGGFTLQMKIGEGKVSEKTSRRMFFASGAGTLINRILDIYSSVRFSRLMSDSRFYEYGLNAFHSEGGRRYSFHATPQEFFNTKNLLIEVTIVGIGTVCLPFGYAHGASTPFTFLSNMYAARHIELGLAIGDQVKKMIAHYSPEQIRTYLQMVDLTNLQTNKL